MISSCQKATPTPAPIKPPDSFFSKYYDVTSLPVSNSFSDPKSWGTVADPSLEEISGIAPSHAIAKGLWVEEDSGNENKIYLLDNSGNMLADFQMTSVQNRDWEDLSISTGPTPDVRYIYLAETGDNKHIYQTKTIYRFPEPSFTDKTFPFSGQVNTVDEIIFHFPDGKKNSEAVMIDPSTNDIYVISKENLAVIYVARYPQPLNQDFEITKLGIIPITDVTAADISSDGNEVVIKNYNQIFYWKKIPNESIADLLQQTPMRLPYVAEVKGESICWAADGSGYFVTSEGTNQPIYFYQRK